MTVQHQKTLHPPERTPPIRRVFKKCAESFQRAGNGLQGGRVNLMAPAEPETNA